MYRDIEDVDDDVLVCVFICVDVGFGQVLGFFEEDLWINFDYGYEIDDGEEDEGVVVEELLVFVDVEEEGGVDCDVKFVRLLRLIVL